MFMKYIFITETIALHMMDHLWKLKCPGSVLHVTLKKKIFSESESLTVAVVSMSLATDCSPAIAAV